MLNLTPQDWTAIALSLRIAVVATLVSLPFGIAIATLLARNRFGPSAAAPLLYNGGIIAGGLFLTPRLDVGVEGFAWGALVGAVLGPLLAPLLDARGRVRVGVRVGVLVGPAGVFVRVGVGVGVTGAAAKLRTMARPP